MNQISMIEVFGNTRKKKVKLDNPLSFDQCYISSVSLYTDFVLHNVPTDQVVVINAGSALQEVAIPQGAYDIETIIAMLHSSDAFTVWISVLWRERLPYHCGNLLLDRFHECSWDPIDPRIRIKCACERTGQSTIILPEYLVQLNNGDKRHHVLRAIDVFWILYISGVHRSSE